MTGRERAEYLRWKKEREQIDEERLARHRNATGQWRREWDAQKTDSMWAIVVSAFLKCFRSNSVLSKLCWCLIRRFKEDTYVSTESGTAEQSGKRGE